MFEFKDVTLDGDDGAIEYYWYDLLEPGRWSYRFEGHFKLAII